MSAPTSMEAAALLTAAALFPPRGNPVRSTEHVNVFGRDVHVDIFEPDAAVDRHRTILVLHGVGGLLGDGSFMRRAAREFAAGGFRAGVVHYFNATGTLFATHANVRDHAVAWKDAVVEISGHYAAMDGAPIGLFGYSLGGFLAVGAAPQVPGVRAVAVMAGGILEEHEALTFEHLPPLLVLHGGSDSKVPPERAEALMRMARLSGVRAESVMYPHEGHVFDARAERDAFARAVSFFGGTLASTKIRP